MTTVDWPIRAGSRGLMTRGRARFGIDRADLDRSEDLLRSGEHDLTVGAAESPGLDEDEGEDDGQDDPRPPPAPRRGRRRWHVPLGEQSRNLAQVDGQGNGLGIEGTVGVGGEGQGGELVIGDGVVQLGNGGGRVRRISADGNVHGHSSPPDAPGCVVAQS